MISWFPGTNPAPPLQFDLPKSRQPTKATPADIETERLSSWWMVADMYTFENIGFSHAVGTIKYLVCADCEVGPIGYHDKTTAKSYISHDRVRHV